MRHETKFETIVTGGMGEFTEYLNKLSSRGGKVHSSGISFDGGKQNFWAITSTTFVVAEEEDVERNAAPGPDTPRPKE